MGAVQCRENVRQAAGDIPNTSHNVIPDLILIKATLVARRFALDSLLHNFLGQVSGVSCSSTTVTLTNVVDSFKHSKDTPGHVFIYEGSSSSVLHETEFDFKR